MKYANNRMVFRRGGRFTTPPTLGQLGYDVNDRERTCRGCGGKSIPLVLSGTCCHCGLELAFMPAESPPPRHSRADAAAP